MDETLINLPHFEWAFWRKKTEFQFWESDFVPHSFYWFFSKGDKQGMNGGVILHGFGATFSVELTAPKYPHWSVHT